LLKKKRKYLKKDRSWFEICNYKSKPNQIKSFFNINTLNINTIDINIKKYTLVNNFFFYKMNKVIIEELYLFKMLLFTLKFIPMKCNLVELNSLCFRNFE